MWVVPAFAVKMLVRCLRAGEDETVKHYAIKAIQNVSIR
jgi:hypothetical protein